MKFIIPFLVSLWAGGALADTVKSDVEPGKEYSTGFLGHERETGQLHFSPAVLTGFPPTLDLRTTGEVSTIKNQGSCGSCWSFAITKALESARLKAGLPELDLSEQQMVSCDKNAYGCNGGNMDDADYIVNPGLALESDYKYTATSSKCKNPVPVTADKAKSWAYVGGGGRKPTVAELKTAIAQYGVIFVTVSAGGNDWGGSTVHMKGCGQRGTNHMVALVGYNADDEFIIGNSWGTNWGENGFAYAKQGCDDLANETTGAAFVVYEGGPAPVPPHIRLPAEISIMAGTEVLLGVRLESGVTYEWSDPAGKILGHDPTLWVSLAVDTVYKLAAVSRAGKADSSVLVKVIPQ